MPTLFKRQILSKFISLTLLLLATALLAQFLRAPLAAVLAQQQPTQPAGVLINQPPCVAFSERGVDFDFLGYVPQGDGTTVLAWRITNPGGRALDAVGFTASRWTPIAPGERTVYNGALGDYGVRWALHNLTPSHEAFSFQPQGDWFKAGVQETFVLTVDNFDPQRQLFAWVRANTRLTQVHLKPGGHNCLLAPPTPSPMPTATATPASPLPTPTPNPALTLDDYSFSEPQVVLTHTRNLLVLNWLSDSQRALIVREDRTPEDFKQLVQVFNVATGEFQTYGDVNAMEPTAAWLAGAEKIAFLAQQSGFRALYLSDTATQQPVEVATGRLWPMIAANRNRLMVLASNQTAPLVFDSQGNLLPLPPINLHDYGINVAPAFGVALRWRPTEDKVAIFDGGGFLVYDLETGNVQPYELDETGRHWAYTGEWSPDGRNFALNYVEGPPVFRLTQLALLDVNTNEVRVISLPLTWISDIVWAQNSRQLIAAGVIGKQPKERAALYLVDIVTGENRELAQLEQLFWPNSQDGNLSWSPDGSKLLFRCRLSETILPSALCESSITLGGGK